MFISARYRNIHIVSLGCYCFTSTFPREKGGWHVANELCPGYSEAAKYQHCLRKELKTVIKLLKKGAGENTAMEPPMGLKKTHTYTHTQRASQRRQNEKQAYRRQTGGCHLGEKS